MVEPKSSSRAGRNRYQGGRSTLTKGLLAMEVEVGCRSREKGVTPVHTFERSDHGEPGHFFCRAAA